MIGRVLILSFVLCLFTSCTSAPNNSNTANVNTAPSPAATPSPVQSQQSSAPITLPLLDALLTDDKFVDGLRTRVKLTNEQIDSLKRISSEEITRLREANAEELDGSSGDPGARATEQLNQIVGDEKARELTAFANEYWSKGDPSEAAGNGGGPAPEMLKGPNAVPTDTRVVVNIPAFRMDLFENGSLVKSYQVGIGYPQFPLPQGMRKASQIILNPTWTPPHSPWVAEMKNITPGETVEAGSKLNPLGPIKIPIGLPSLIHGGKAPAKIGRFASHGCVGLTNNQVKDFALLLSKASGTELSNTTLANYLEDKNETKTVKLSQSVPVELRYETIVLEDGKLYIYKDVYTQNTNTEENLRSVLEAHGVKFDDLPEQQRTELLNALNAMSANPRATASPSPSPSPDKKTARRKEPAKKVQEVVVEIATLAGKGYPAPVNLDTGSGKPAPQKRTRNTHH